MHQRSTSIAVKSMWRAPLITASTNAGLKIKALPPQPLLAYRQPHSPGVAPPFSTTAFFKFGSSFFHGDQASQAARSLTWANTVAGGAAMVADRCTENVLGYRLIATYRPTDRTARTIRIFLAMVELLQERAGG